MRKLAGLRVTAGLTQEEVAKALGKTQGAISQWERLMLDPPLEDVFKLANLYGTTAQEIVDSCMSAIHATSINGKEGLDNDQRLRHAIQNQQE